MGCTDYRTNVIKIHNGQTIELRVSSLIHECLHRLNTHYKKEEHEPMFEATEKEVFAKLTKKEYNNLKKYIS